MKNLIVVFFVIGSVGCAQQVPMGDSVQNMIAAQTDNQVTADNVGGGMAGIGDRVGATYRGAIDKPDDVKQAMNIRFIGK